MIAAENRGPSEGENYCRCTRPQVGIYQAACTACGQPRLTQDGRVLFSTERPRLLPWAQLAFLCRSIPRFKAENK